MRTKVKILVSEGLDFECKNVRMFDLLNSEQRKSIIDEYSKPCIGAALPVNPKIGEPYFAMSDAPFNSDWVAHNPVVIPLD